MLLKRPFVEGAVITLLVLNSIFLYNCMSRISDLEHPKTEATLALPENFNFAFVRLKAFNKLVDSSTVIALTEAANKFSLTDNLDQFKWGLAQLMTESGVTHVKSNGDVLTSPSGAVGIGQILPNTAYGYLTSKADAQDKAVFKILGCDDISFLEDKSMNKKSKVKKMKDWLRNEKNNLAMWAFIMKDSFESRKNPKNAILAYNLGIGGLKTYLDSGLTADTHAYVMNIQRKMQYIEARVN